MNKYWDPPSEDGGDPEDQFDAWFDVWIDDDDGSLHSYLGCHGQLASLPSLKTAMQMALDDLLSGRTKRIPNPRNPSRDIDLNQAVLMVRVAHQRNGEVSCGWARFSSDPRLLRPLRELAAIAAARLPEEPVAGGNP